MSMLRLLIFCTLIVLSVEQRRTGIGTGRELNIRTRFGGAPFQPPRPPPQQPEPRSSQEIPSTSTQETAEYVYEYYDEPDYQHYPPRPAHHHHQNQQSSHYQHQHQHPILESLQPRRVNPTGNGNGSPTIPTAVRANILANSRERFFPTTPTRRPPPPQLQAQLSRLIPTVSKETHHKPSTSSTETPAEEQEYEYVYEDEHDTLEAPPAPPSKEIETKVSVSVSASKYSSTPLPKSLSPESGIVISVATTRSVSSRLNQTPQTTPSTPQTPSPPPPPSRPILPFARAVPPPVFVPFTIERTKNVTSSVSPKDQNSIRTNKNDLLRDLAAQEVAHALEIKADSPTSTTTTTTTSPSPLLDLGIKFEDVSKFLPPDYKKAPPPPPSSPPIKSLLPKLLFQEVISQDFLPKDYVLSTPSTTTVAPSSTTTSSTTTSTTTASTTTSSTTTSSTTTTSTTEAPPSTTSTTKAPPPAAPVDPLQALMDKIRFDDDISRLLPPGYKEESIHQSLLPPDYKPPPTNQREASEITVTPPTSTVSASSSTTLLPKVVFPTRPGGLKAARPTISEPPKAETPAPPKVALKSGWPTRKTTEFTGWPTVPTTRMPTTTTPSTTTTIAPSTEPTTTTERTTTTAAPPKRNPVTLCESNVCKMEATLRLTGGVRWKPEYADINTEEWKHLENTVKRELDGAYRSSGLAPFYRSIEIEAFNEGSVVVDYFLLMDNVDREISSEQIRSLFHASLLQAEDPFEKDRLRLGRYTIDPRYTDFKARTFESEGVTGELEEALIPQWGIAVIVIGLASLLFVIIFAVTLMVSKQRKGGKKGGVSLTQEMLNEFNKRSLGSADSSVRREDLYNMDDVWDESRLERTLDLRSGRRSSLSKEGYNIYDSWKTEWHGYNNHFGKGGGDSSTRRRVDYDTDF